MRLFGLPLVLAVAANATPAHANDTLRLAPSSDWTIEKAADSCILSRRFGEGERTVQLYLRSYEPEGRFYVLVRGELARHASHAKKVRIGFADVEHLSVPYLSGTSEGEPGLLLQPVFSLGPLSKEAERRMKNRLAVSSYSDPAIEGKIDTIAFEDGLMQEFVLETGGLHEPMEALRQCSRELTKDWGVTLEERMSFSRVAAPQSNVRWIGTTDFQQHLSKRSLWTLLLIVGENGEVANCRISGAVSPQSAEAACSIARDRARFSPALDADGKPTKDYWLLTYQPL